MKVPIFFLVLLAISFAKTTPDFVLEVFRHGARSVEKNTYDNTWDDIGYGELTSVGIRQHYVLGKLLKEEYADLLLPYDPSKIHVYASAVNRTLMSASSQLYGIYEGIGPSIPDTVEDDLVYPPGNLTKLEEVSKNMLSSDYAAAHKFQPIPIHSNSPTFDYLLQPYSNCPGLDDIYNNHTNDDLVAELFAELNDTVSYLTSLGYSIKKIKDLKDFSDAATSAYYYGKHLPLDMSVDSQLYKDLLIAYQWYEVYPGLAETLQRQVFSAPVLSQLMSGIQGVQTNTSTTRFVFLSGHETTVFTILSALGVATPECLLANWRSQKANGTTPYPECIYPNFAANLIFEFFNTSDPYVVVKYEGQKLHVCGDQTECPLGEFTSLIQNATGGYDLQGFYDVCQVDTYAQTASFEVVKTHDSYPKEVVYAMGVTIVILMATIAVLMRKNSKEGVMSGRNIYYAQTA